MTTVFEPRASTILFNLATTSAADEGVYLLPANVCYVVPLSLILSGMRFEFIDIEEESLCMDGALLLDRLRNRSLPRVRAVVYVRTYGVENEAKTLFEELKSLDQELMIIDDRCASRPEPDSASVDWQGADIVLYSTGYAKYVDLGYGGFAHMHHGVPYKRYVRDYMSKDEQSVISLVKGHIQEGRPLYEGGTSASIPSLLRYAHWLRTDMPEESWQDYKQRIVAEREASDERKSRYNSIYRESIPHMAQLPQEHQAWRFSVRVKDKQALIKKIFQAGCFASDHYYPASLLFGGDDCPVAEDLHDKIVNLFNDSYVTEEQVRMVAKMVAQHVIGTESKLPEKDRCESLTSA